MGYGNMLREGEISIFIDRVNAQHENGGGEEHEDGRDRRSGAGKACPKIGEQDGQNEAHECENDQCFGGQCFHINTSEIFLDFCFFVLIRL